MGKFFTVVSAERRAPGLDAGSAWLVEDGWDDWFTYSTMYTLFVKNYDGEVHRVGSVKIGQMNMLQGQRRPNLEVSFDILSEEFFSVGQDDTYYESLNKIGVELRDKVLNGLRDMAFDTSILSRSLGQKVTGVSLLRSVSRATIQGQYARLAQGGARLSRYDFKYFGSRSSRRKSSNVVLEFVVEPESMPPSNIHVLIGRNGVGKTHLLNGMSRSLLNENAKNDDLGRFEVGDDEGETDPFSNLVSVTFSAFDPFEPLPNRRNRSEGLPCAYLGLKRIGKTRDGNPYPPKSPDRLSREFGASVVVCRSQGAKLSRWRRALSMLQADPIFASADVISLADEGLESDEVKRNARLIFGNLSSGHKIVLLTITRLVETVEERTLVLLDEPEAHLHPPLLSAFVRALSDLLVNRNGVAIVATHSPVVLQEVPSNCVWKIWRNGRNVQAERPAIETFGENVGVLTREIFGLEVTDAGFHQLLRVAAHNETDFDEVVEKFESKLGGEARALVRAMMATREGEQ